MTKTIIRCCRTDHRLPSRTVACLTAAVALFLAGSISAVEYPPPPGTDRESDEYLEEVEAHLESLDLNDPTLDFKRLGGTTATNWSVSKDGRIVADLKCTSGNTDHHGAVIAYRLGRELGFNIYPVAVYRDVKQTIDGRPFDEQCALKEWASVFTQYYWTRETFQETDSQAKRSLVAALKCDHPKPGDKESFEFYARSAYGDPKIPASRRVKYSGQSTLSAVSRDFSNMMVIDTLIGNEDRFPGGNMFFRSVTTSPAEADDAFVFENVRLFSLDNEAAFKGRSPASTHSARDLKQHVSRFDSDKIAKLQRLADDQATLDRMTDGHEELTAFIRDGIRLVLEHVSEAQEQCGREKASF